MIKNKLSYIFFGSLLLSLFAIFGQYAYAASIDTVDFNCTLTNGKWWCANQDLHLITDAKCVFVRDPLPFGGDHSECEKLPDTDTFCRRTDNEASCGPTQKAAVDAIIKNITTDVPTGKTVCKKDKTFPGQAVIYCAPATQVTGCTKSTAGNYSICADWPADNCSAKNDQNQNVACPKPKNTEQPEQIPDQTLSTTKCTGTSCSIDYKLLEPLPGLNVKNLNFASFLGVAFKILITIGALISVGSLVFSGISYMVTDAVGEVGEAKKRMKAAVFGMLILLGAWLLLHTINPQLLEFDLSSIGTLNNNAAPSTQTSGHASSNPTQEDVRHCEVDLHQTIIYSSTDGSWRCSAN